MKRNYIPRAAMLVACLFSFAANALGQAVIPFLECVDQVPLDNSLNPSQLMNLMSFGYANQISTESTLTPGSATNFFLPGNPNRGQPSTFLPGYHRWQVTAGGVPARDLTWLISESATSNYAFAFGRADAAFRCSDPSTTPFLVPSPLKLLRGTTYQGLELSKLLWAAPPAGSPTATAAVYQGSFNSLPNMSVVGSPDFTVTNLQVTANSVVGDVTVQALNQKRYHALALKLLLNGQPVAVKSFGVETFDSCPITVTPSALPAGVAGFGYAPVVLSATGSTGPYTFEIGAGTLPPGLTLVNGAISGVPTVAGTYNFRVNAISSVPCMASQAFTLDIAGPACATDVTDRIAFTLGGFRQNLATGRWQQTITLRNSSSTNIGGPISIALQNVSANATLYNTSGSTRCAIPLGRPYVSVNLGGLGALAPGQAATATLEFTNTSPSQAITYSPRVLAGGISQ